MLRCPNLRDTHCSRQSCNSHFPRRRARLRCPILRDTLCLRKSYGQVRQVTSRALQVVAFTQNGNGDETKCPVARMFNSGQSLSSKSYDPAPYTSADYQGTKYRMGMGLSPMKLQDWIEIDEEYEEDIEIRRELLAKKRDIVLQSRPEAEEANKELLSILAQYLPEQFPDRFRLTEGSLVNNATGDIFDLNDPSLDPLEVCSLLVQEDLCLMMTDERGELRFVSGAVLFPQRWSLIEKIGMNMDRIHMPVPLYHESISKPVSTFMKRLEVQKPYWRCNWTVADNPQKFQPLDESAIGQVNTGVNLNEEWLDQPVTNENAGHTLTTRMERETLRRLPKTGAVLFTIRTYIKPLSRFSRDPEKARQLAKALRILDPSVAQYKTLAPFKDQALHYLDQCAAQALAVA